MSELFGNEPFWVVALKAVLIFVVLVALHAVQHLVRASRGRAHAAPHRPQRARPVRPAAEPRRRRQARAQGGHRRQGGRQGRLRRGADPGHHPGVPRLGRHPDRPRGHHPVHRHRHAAAAHRPAGGRALHPRRHLDRHLRHRARRLVVRLDLRPPGRHALERADDLLRGRDGAVVRLGVHVRRVDVDVGDRRGPVGHLVLPAAVPVVRHLRHRDGRRDEPRAVRPARGRGRARRRLPHRVLLAQVRAVLPGRVRQHGHRLGAGHDAVPRRLARTVRHRAGLGGRQQRLLAAAVVLRQDAGVHLPVHLAARHAAPDALRPVHDVRLEGAHPVLAGLDRGRRVHPQAQAGGPARPADAGVGRHHRRGALPGDVPHPGEEARARPSRSRRPAEFDAFADGYPVPPDAQPDVDTPKEARR